jgi:hypothetical protein
MKLSRKYYRKEYKKASDIIFFILLMAGAVATMGMIGEQYIFADYAVGLVLMCGGAIFTLEFVDRHEAKLNK